MKTKKNSISDRIIGLKRLEYLYYKRYYTYEIDESLLIGLYNTNIGVNIAIQ